VTSNTQETPRRFELGDRFRVSQASARGTVVVRAAEPYGFGARFTTASPCCSENSRIDAIDASWGGAGTHVICRGCGWKWIVHLTRDGTRITGLPETAAHPDIRADRAEWVSQGYGRRVHRRRRA
jgi:hypothetical protein